MPDERTVRGRWSRYRNWEVWSLHGAVLLPAAFYIGLSFCCTADQLESGASPLPACMYRSWTGHGCPTCGMTRAICCLSHGDWGRAVRYHSLSPAVYAGLFLAGAAGLVSLGSFLAARRLPPEKDTS